MKVFLGVGQGSLPKRRKMQRNGAGCKTLECGAVCRCLSRRCRTWFPHLRLRPPAPPVVGTTPALSALNGVLLKWCVANTGWHPHKFRGEKGGDPWASGANAVGATPTNLRRAARAFVQVCTGRTPRPMLVSCNHTRGTGAAAARHGQEGGQTQKMGTKIA